MGLQGTVFDFAPYEEIKRLVENMRKLIEKRIADLESEDAALKNIHSKFSEPRYVFILMHWQVSYIEGLLEAYANKAKALQAVLDKIEGELRSLPDDLQSRVFLSYLICTYL